MLSVVWRAADGCVTVPAEDGWYMGAIDAGVVHQAVLAEDAASHLRIGFVHHQSRADKEIYDAGQRSKVLLSSLPSMYYLRDLLHDLVCIYASARLLPLLALSINWQSHLT